VLSGKAHFQELCVTLLSRLPPVQAESTRVADIEAIASAKITTWLPTAGRASSRFGSSLSVAPIAPQFRAGDPVAPLWSFC
jgi:hypothetical protein